MISEYVVVVPLEQDERTTIHQDIEVFLENLIQTGFKDYEYVKQIAEIAINLAKSYGGRELTTIIRGFYSLATDFFVEENPNFDNFHKGDLALIHRYALKLLQQELSN